MSEPRRLIDEGGSPEMRRALYAGIDIVPPAGAERRVWAGLSAAIVAAGSTMTASAAGAAKSIGAASVGAASVTKLVAIGISAGAIALGGQAAWRSMNTPHAAPIEAMVPGSPRSEPPSLSRLGAEGPAPNRKAEPATELSSPEASPPSTSAPSPTARPSSNRTGFSAGHTSRSNRPAAPDERRASPPSTDSVQAPAVSIPSRPDESSVVLRAREALRRGDAEQALAILEGARRDFSEGGLAQEREAPAVEALVVTGPRSEAVERAKAFVERYPSSPYAARIRSLAH